MSDPITALTEVADPTAPITAYKGFDADLTCRGFQFAEGKTYEESHAELCRSGFHACEQPIHVLRYYRPGTSVFHTVELADVSPERHTDDSKLVARKITIGGRVSLAGLIEAQVKYVTLRAKPAKGSTTRANNRAASNSDESGAATASGWSGAATASGESGAATASGEGSIAVVTGGNAKARGDAGSWLVLTERDLNYTIVGVQSVRVDGEGIKAGAWYALRGGQVVPA